MVWTLTGHTRVMDTRPYCEAAGKHEAAAATHDELAARWEADGDRDRADLERRSAALERMAAELERDRAALTERRIPGPYPLGRGVLRPPLRSEIERAVEILRGTTYDFRIEATIDVVSLFGPEVLVAALERLDAEIEPRPSGEEAARTSSPWST